MFLYFFKISIRLLNSFFSISLKLLQKDFLKFPQNIININFELLQSCLIMFPLFSCVKIFLSLSLKFLQTFLAIFSKFHQNISKVSTG